MSPERLKIVEEIYHAVLEISPPERDSFLNEKCGSDADLRREIASLLSYENDFDSLIDSAPKSLVEEVFSPNKASNLIGKQINQYKIERKIGEGGMGAVYLARDSKLERKVAVKFLSEEFSKDATRRNRFFQEAKSASALNHPNILTVHEIGEFDGTHFIVTEFIKGRTLSPYLAEEKPTLQKVLEIAAQIASALSAAHEAGIIHRDIKPDNVMVRDDGIVKVLDFGIAKLSEKRGGDTERERHGENDSTLIAASVRSRVPASPETLPGMIIGTPQYMSPEQARGQKIDLRSDIFSFGVLLYEMLAGQPPFNGATKMDIIGSILKDEPKPLREYQPEIPHDLEHIIQKTLRKDREQRYQHIKDLFIDLTDIKKTLEFDTKLVHQTEIAKAATTVNTTSGIVMQRRFSLVHLLGFLLIAVLSFTAIWWFFFKNNTQNISNLKTEEVVNWTSSPGEIYSVGSFSPDGKMVAFTSTKVGTKNIWIKQASSGEAIQITKDDSNNENPIWSPNGEELAYFSRKNQEAGFWRIPTLGGSPKLISKVINFNSRLLFWSKTNEVYYESANEIFAIDSASGQTKQVTQLVSQGIKGTSFRISPDEKNLTYITTEGNNKILWLTNLAGETPKKIFSSPTEIKNIAWHPDNRRIFYSAVVDGTFQIFVTDIYGISPRQLTSSEQDSLVLDVSSDGGKILYGSTKEESDIWGFNLRENKEFTVASDINSELWADVSPDGKSVAYQSIKNLSQANKLFGGSILTKSLGTNEQPTEIAKNGGLPKWSPNGKTVVFIRVNSGIHNLFAVNTQGGEEKPLTTDGIIGSSYSVLPYNRVYVNDFSWSPDSSKIVYVSRQNEQHNLWLINADGTNNTLLTENTDPKININCPLWSNDGKKIAYSSKINDSQGKAVYTIKIIDTETKKDDPVISGKSFMLIGWSGSGNELILASVENNGTAALPSEVFLQTVEAATGKLKQIQVLKDAYIYNVHLSPDKKTIAFTSHQEGKDNLWVMPTTDGEPKKMTNNNDSRLYFSSLAWSPDSNSIFYGKQLRYSLLSMLTNFQ